MAGRKRALGTSAGAKTASENKKRSLSPSETVSNNRRPSKMSKRNSETGTVSQEGSALSHGQAIEKSGDSESLTMNALQGLQEMIRASIDTNKRSGELLREEIGKSAEENKKTIEEQRKYWERAIEQGTSKCMDAISDSVAKCTERIEGMEDRVEALDQGLQVLRRDVDQLKNRTSRAAANVTKDEIEFAECRRTLLLWPIVCGEEESENASQLKSKVESFFKEKMKLGKIEIAALGDYSVSRPLPSGGKLEEAPVHVKFKSSGDRDFIMSRSHILRNENGERVGSIKMKVPKFLMGLKRALEMEAAKIRSEEGLWAQLRLVDDPEMLVIFTRAPRKDDPDARWIKRVLPNQQKKSFA